MNTIAPQFFRYALDGGVATITLARPDTLNSLTFEVYAELTATFADMNAHDEIRAVLLTGEGRAFCSGGDVAAIIGELFARDMRGLVAFTRMTGELIANIRRLRKPVVCAVNGLAVGAGAVMVAASDFRVASETAKIGFLFPRVGLCGADMGAAYLLPRLVGLSKASELLFLGDVIEASEALRIGLYHRVVPAADCVATARSLADRLASGPAFAHAMTKQMLEGEHTMSLDAAIEAEAQAQAICMQHPDFALAYEGWKNKKPVVFTGAPAPFRDKP